LEARKTTPETTFPHLRQVNSEVGKPVIAARQECFNGAISMTHFL